MGDRKWCTCQMECSDIDGWACCAHLGEGHVFPCGYREEDIDPDIGRPVHKQPPGSVADGVCRDYESYVEKVTKRLMGG